MVVTLIDLLLSLSDKPSEIWDKIFVCFNKYYPDQLEEKDNYIDVIRRLLQLTINVDPDICIYFTDDIEEIGCISVHIKDPTGSYSPLGTPWKVFLGFIIDENTLEQYSKQDIVGHCLWEMTFLGFNEEKI